MAEPTDQGGSSPHEVAPTASLWRSPNFLKYISARWFNSLAIQLITVTVGWQIYEMTSDPIDLGLVGLSQVVPIFVLFLVSGLAADRLNRRAIIAACNLTHVLVVGFLFYTR